MPEGIQYPQIEQTNPKLHSGQVYGSKCYVSEQVRSLTRSVITHNDEMLEFSVRNTTYRIMCNTIVHVARSSYASGDNLKQHSVVSSSHMASVSLHKQTFYRHTRNSHLYSLFAKNRELYFTLQRESFYPCTLKNEADFQSY